MQIKPPQLSIPDDNPFAEDALNRAESAEILTQLISTIDEPFVLAIDSAWGTGKTTFLKMWVQSLKNKGFPCLYFNAWENDFSNDPMVSLIGEIETGIDYIGLVDERKRKLKEYFSKAKELGVTFVKRSLPAAIKIATAGALDLEELSEQALADLATNYAKERIDKYEADKLTVKNFKIRLADFVKELSTVSGTGESRPLIFFIDELDRCRPNYALELLEKAKHLFDIKGIIFILTLDKQQIGHSIRCLYGAGMDVDGYLRRFIDLDYRLPDPPKEVFCRFLFERFGFSEYFKNRVTRDARYETEQFLNVFSNLCVIFGLSLRVQEQCFSQLSLVLRTTPSNFKVYPVFLGTLVALKASNLELYRDYVKKIADAQKVLQYISEMPGGTVFLQENYGIELEAYLVIGHGERKDLNEIRDRYGRTAEDSGQSENNRERARRILGLLDHFSMYDSYGMVAYLAKKIEVADRFITS